LTFAISLLTI